MTRPAPPPEAVLIRLVRQAAGIKLPAAAKAAGVSKGRWSQVETGYETRAGAFKPVVARADTLAHMAHAIRLDPDRLATEGGRPDAAEVLREILRQEARSPKAGADLDFMEWFTDRALKAGRTEAERAAFRAREGWDSLLASARPDLDDYGMWRRLAAFLRRPALELMRDAGIVTDEDFPAPPGPGLGAREREERRR